MHIGKYVPIPARRDSPRAVGRSWCNPPKPGTNPKEGEIRERTDRPIDGLAVASSFVRGAPLFLLCLENIAVLCPARIARPDTDREEFSASIQSRIICVLVCDHLGDGRSEPQYGRGASVRVLVFVSGFCVMCWMNFIHFKPIIGLRS